MELKDGEIICPECEGRRYENEQWGVIRKVKCLYLSQKVEIKIQEN